MKRITWLTLSLVCLLLLSGVTLAAVLDYSPLTWWTVDGGGGTGAGSGYTLDGTAGQPDAGQLLTGGSYQLEGGFWGGALSGTAQQNIYLPLVVR